MLKYDMVEVFTDIWPEISGVLIFFGSMVAFYLLGRIIDFIILTIRANRKRKKRRG